MAQLNNKNYLRSEEIIAICIKFMCKNATISPPPDLQNESLQKQERNQHVQGPLQCYNRWMEEQKISQITT